MPLHYTLPLLILASSIIVASVIIAGGAPREHAAHTPARQSIPFAPITDADHRLGDLDAKVTLLEYSDVDCPQCARFHVTMHRIMDAYEPGEVAWVYRHFPLDGIHPHARDKAEALECLGKLGGNDAFWHALDAAFAAPPITGDMAALAAHVGVERAAFEACRSSAWPAEVVRTHARDAEMAGARGTPYTIIIARDGTTIPMLGAQSYQAVTAVIDGLLQAAY
jgi:protein-disulfide isomerase